MRYDNLSARRHRPVAYAGCLTLCASLTTLSMVSLLPPPSAAEPPTTLSTGIVPTMGLHDVTEGALLFRTTQAGRTISTM